MKFLVVSPHFDDAVFSICEHMLGWIEDGHDVQILVVFGAVPDGAEKEKVLAAEHDAAMIALGVPVHYTLSQLDDAHGPALERQTEIFVLANRLVDAIDADVTLWPTGIHHPDHLLVANLPHRAGSPWERHWHYDELPYYVLYPVDAETGEHYERVGSRDFLARKREIVACYASQLGQLEERCLYAPERVWSPK